MALVACVRQGRQRRCRQEINLNVSMAGDSPATQWKQVRCKGAGLMDERIEEVQYFETRVFAFLPLRIVAGSIADYTLFRQPEEL